MRGWGSGRGEQGEKEMGDAGRASLEVSLRHIYRATPLVEYTEQFQLYLPMLGSIVLGTLFRVHVSL